MSSVSKIVLSVGYQETVMLGKEGASTLVGYGASIIMTKE